MKSLPALSLVLCFVACGDKQIPAHVTEEQVKTELEASDPTRFLTGGERIFFEDFERAELGPKWVIERLEAEPNPPTWTLDNGWLRNTDAKNQGAWIEILPTTGKVRIEFLAVSDKPKTGKFVGDIKCEAFATAPKHEAGYSFINGGWSNQFDTIAKLGEHSADDKRKPAKPVEEGRVHRYAVVVTDTKLHFFREGELLYTFDDPRPVRGPWFAFNNWLTHARFDELAVFKLP
jgi:hypothetical protein